MLPSATPIDTLFANGALPQTALFDSTMPVVTIPGNATLPAGIRVNAVAPGPVWTPLNPSDKSAADVAQFDAETPMKRAAQPEEIAPAYVFLASAQCSRFITGEILPIIGGYSGG